MAAPLFFSGDMNYLDPFTINVLCNAEVIGVDQDEAAKQARVIRRTDADFVLAKPLADGSFAVGLFNLAGDRRTVAASWTELGLKGRCSVRDLWRQKDAGTAMSRYSAEVNAHGVSLVRLTPAKQ